MNFKNILSISVLALFSAANAAPLLTKDNAKAIIEGCNAKSGYPFVTINSSEATYTCLVPYENQDDIPKESTCFYHNENTVLCIDNEYSSFKECNKSNKDYYYFTCVSTIHNFVNGKKSKKLTLNRPLVSYPEKVRYAISPRADQKECKDNHGLVFTYQSIFQYACLYPESNFESTENEHCVTVNGKPYCVFDDDTSLGFCKKSSDFYNSEVCNYTLKYVGNTKQMKVEEN